MTPLERLRIEKAAADCGFEMTPEVLDGGLQLRSARFPERVTVRPAPGDAFSVTASPSILPGAEGAGTASVAGYLALYELLRACSARARTLPNRVADAFHKQTALLPRATEAERLVIQRVGQDLFRAALLDYWQGRCCVTGLALPELLRASHIKPWSQCGSDEERLDVYNGLLLAPHVDALFDGGWISFADDGRVLLSAGLDEEALARLGCSTGWRLVALSERHRPYLAQHRTNCFRSRERLNPVPGLARPRP